MNWNKLSLKWKLMIISTTLILIISATMGLVTYKNFLNNAYESTENDLRLIAQDWKITTETYIDQKERVLKREEFLFKKRLESITLDVWRMLDILYKTKGPEIPSKDMNILLEEIAEIKLGRSGYVFIFGSDGKTIIHSNEMIPQSNLFDIVDEEQQKYFTDIFTRLKKFDEKKTLITKYNWSDETDKEKRPRLGAFSYYEPLDIIIGTSAYYTDFKSYELEDILKEEIEYKMAELDIGKNGYLWVVDGQGNFVVSKDRLRDGENVLEEKDDDGVYFFKEMIEKAKVQNSSEKTYVHYYPWKNLDEDKKQDKLAAVTYVPEWDWIIGASAHEKDFLKDINKLRIEIIGIAIISVLIFSSTSYLLFSFLFQPLQELETISQKVSEGNFKQDIDKSITEKKDEIGNLAKSFKTMIKEINKQFDKINKFNKELESKVNQRTKDLENANKNIKRLLKTKTEFLNQVAHDLRTPLTPISLLLNNVLKQGKYDKKTKERLTIIKRNVQSLSYLVTDVLNLVRLDSEKNKLNMEIKDPIKFVKEYIEMNKPALEKDNIKIMKKFDNNIPTLKFDPNKIGQVIGNIISNARKYYDKKEKKMIFEIKKQKKEVMFKIIDNGKGIDKKELKSIFKEFYKSEQYHGGSSTGLGLAICQKIVEQHKGKIWAESKGLGKGTSIIFTLPIAKKKSDKTEKRKKTSN